MVAKPMRESGHNVGNVLLKFGWREIKIPRQIQRGDRIGISTDGRGEKPAQIIESMRMVAEGVPTTLSAWDCAKRFGIEAPVTQEIHAVLYEDKSLLEAMAELMERPPKSETDTGTPSK